MATVRSPPPSYQRDDLIAKSRATGATDREIHDTVPHRCGVLYGQPLRRRTGYPRPGRSGDLRPDGRRYRHGGLPFGASAGELIEERGDECGARTGPISVRRHAATTTAARPEGGMPHAGWPISGKPLTLCSWQSLISAGPMLVQATHSGNDHSSPVGGFRLRNSSIQWLTVVNAWSGLAAIPTSVV